MVIEKIIYIEYTHGKSSIDKQCNIRSSVKYFYFVLILKDISGVLLMKYI